MPRTQAPFACVDAVRGRPEHFSDFDIAEPNPREVPEDALFIDHEEIGLRRLAANDKILGVRAGIEHRYTGVWVVVLEGRAFVRSWNDKPTGWYRAFKAEPFGSIQLAGREIAVPARRTRGERLRNAISRAYAQKYTTKASEKWVRGFAEPHRAVTTPELVPE